MKFSVAKARGLSTRHKNYEFLSMQDSISFDYNLVEIEKQVQKICKDGRYWFDYTMLDNSGYKVKEALIDYLTSLGYETIDFKYIVAYENKIRIDWGINKEEVRNDD